MSVGNVYRCAGAGAGKGMNGDRNRVQRTGRSVRAFEDEVVGANNRECYERSALPFMVSRSQRGRDGCG